MEKKEGLGIEKKEKVYKTDSFWITILSIGSLFYAAAGLFLMLNGLLLPLAITFFCIAVVQIILLFTVKNYMNFLGAILVMVNIIPVMLYYFGWSLC